MKLLRLFKLGHKNLTHNKKQTILTIIVIGSLFSVLIGLQFIVQGVENYLIKQNNRIFSDTIYFSASGCNTRKIEAIYASCLEKEEEEMFECHNEISKQPLSCSSDADKINKLFSERSKNYGGEVIGNIKTVKKDNTDYTFYPHDVFKNQIESDLTKRPADTVPALASFYRAAELAGIIIPKQIATNQEKLDLISKVRSESIGKVFDYNGSKIFVAGILPFGAASPTLARNDYDFRVLDLIISANFETSAPIYFINDNSDYVKNFIEQATLYEYSSVIKFTDLYQAYSYYKFENNLFEPSLFAQNAPKSPEYLVRELVANRLSTIHNYKLLRFMISFANYILLIIAIIIIVFTFLKLVNQDSRLIALCRSLGATSKDVFVIYFWYLLELCLLTAIYATIVAIIFAVITSQYYAADFTTSTSLYFGQKISDPVLLLGFNIEFVKIIAVILFSAPLASLLTLDQLSMKNVAKRLKKQ